MHYLCLQVTMETANDVKVKDWQKNACVRGTKVHSCCVEISINHAHL